MNMRFTDCLIKVLSEKDNIFHESHVLFCLLSETLENEKINLFNFDTGQRWILNQDAVNKLRCADLDCLETAIKKWYLWAWGAWFMTKCPICGASWSECDYSSLGYGHCKKEICTWCGCVDTMDDYNI